MNPTAKHTQNRTRDVFDGEQPPSPIAEVEVLTLRIPSGPLIRLPAFSPSSDIGQCRRTLTFSLVAEH